MTINIDKFRQTQSSKTYSSENAGPLISNSVLGRMSHLWATILNSKSDALMTRADNITNSGADKPGDLALLTAATHEMSYLTNAAVSCNDTLGKALESLSRKN